MKLRWGTAIVLSFILFISFMGYLVFQILKKPELQHSLVTSNYYQKEQTLNALIQAKKNARDLRESMHHVQTENHIHIGPLPTAYKLNIVGYCPSDASKDFTINTTLTKTPYVNIPKSTLGTTRWTLRFQWHKKDSLFVIDYPLAF